MLDPDQCPPDPDKTAEVCLLHHMTPEEARVFEEHYMTCARCARVVEETEMFIVAMREAAERLRRAQRRGSTALASEGNLP